MKNKLIINNKEYTRDPIKAADMEANDILCVGTNKQGHHFGGAARFAFQNLGAEWGVGEGRTGKTYAFPTLNFASTDLTNDPNKFTNLPHKVSIEAFDASMLKLKEAILAEPDKTFYITKLGLGIAGWDLWEVHKSFWESGIPLECKNIVFPMEFELPNDACE